MFGADLQTIASAALVAGVAISERVTTFKLKRRGHSCQKSDTTRNSLFLYCMIVELIDDFFAEYPVNPGELDRIDTSEVITAIAKTVAERKVQPGQCNPSAIDRTADARNYEL